MAGVAQWVALFESGVKCLLVRQLLLLLLGHGLVKTVVVEG